MNSARETHEELKVKELVIMDLSKKLAETGSRLRDFSKLYDTVKSDRNKYVNQIQASAQARPKRPLTKASTLARPICGT